jgi:hypothetical protein
MLLSWFTIAVAQALEPPPDPQLADIVVTARPAPLAPLLMPVAYLRRHCFDPLRLTGRFAPPVDDADWRELRPEITRRFGQADGGAPAYSLKDPKRGHTLLIRFERLPGRKGWNVVEDRCTLAVIGGDGHAGLVDAMAGLFRASGTQRHVGASDGVPALPALPGWRQWIWSGIFNRRLSA